MKGNWQVPPIKKTIFLVFWGFFFPVYSLTSFQEVELSTFFNTIPKNQEINNLYEINSPIINQLTPIPTWSPNPLTPTPLAISLDSNHWEKIEIPNDPKNSAIYQITQSSNGDIWIRGSISFLRFHKNEWHQYLPQNIPEIIGKRIESVVAGSDGTIWFGTAQNEIVSFNGKFWLSETVHSGGYRKNIIEALVFRNTDELCAISTEGLSCRFKNNNWTHYDFLPEKGRVEFQDVVVSPSGDIWITLSNGLLYHFDGKIWENIRIDDWLGPIALAGDKTLWMFNKDRFGKRNNNGDIEFTYTFPILINFPPVEMLESKDGTLWLGCIGDQGYGILRYIKKGVLVTVDGKELSTKEISPNLNIRYPFGIQVRSIFQDKDGYIWFGTSNGLFRYHD